MAYLHCASQVMYSSAMWNPAADRAPLISASLQNSGSFNGGGIATRSLRKAILKGFRDRRDIMLGVEGRDLNLWILHEESLVRASGRRGNSLFELGDGDAEEGPIELPPRELEIDPLAFPEASPAQIVASFALTGAIAVLLLRSLRRRAQRAKEMQFRSSGVATTESVKEDARKAAIDSLKKAPEIPVPPPSPGQTLLGAAVAGVIALLLYKFTTSVEGSFSGKAISMNYSIRNLTITVRTIINGLLYLATFVFAANSLGLGLYSLQLLWGSDPLPDPTRAESVEKLESTSESSTDKSKEVEEKSEQ